MKKPVKIILTVCCTALVLFLLLPFLETQAPSSKNKEAAPQAEPQIFTSNPLTELVSRIARFFSGKKAAGPADSDSRRELTAEQAAEQFGEPQENTLYASAQAPSSEGANYTGDGAAYADAYLQNEDGEWVLIRQTAPEGSTRGMHEINAQDNAYDRYITQERQARFTPVMRTPKTKEEVPDSKLARVFNPIKRLFGFGEEPASSGALRTDDRFASGKLASSSGLDKNKEKRSILPKKRAIDWNGIGGNLSSAEPGSAEATKSLADLIMPDAELKNIAEWLADIKYPNAENDPKAEQEKENFKEQQREKNFQQFNQETAKIMEEKAQTPEENTLFAMIKDSCGDKIVSVKKASCDTPNKKEDPISTYQKLNTRYFYEETGLPLPPAKIAVVLQRTDQEIPTIESINQTRLKDEFEPLPQQVEQTINMYRFMQEKCPDCYWVATGEGPAQELKQTIEATGLTLEGDPLHLQEQYIQDYLAQQQKNGMQPEELTELEKNLRDNPTPYTAYPQESLQQLHQNIKNLLDEKKEQARPEDVAVPFFTQASTASQYYNDTGRKHPLFYGNATATQDATLQQRSQALTKDIATFVNDWRGIMQNIKQENAQEGTADLVRPKVRQIREDLQKDMQNFNATNDIGTYQK